jgi:putative two-component system response regulator
MKTIFIVDDSDINLLLAKKAMEDHYNIFTITSGVKMFKFLEKIIPDLILLDIEMPEMDGFETLQKLKSNFLYKDIPVIFLTSHMEERIETLGFKLGAVDFISKPFSTPVLLKRVKIHLDIDGLLPGQSERIKYR